MQHEFTVPKTPEQNGVAERMNRTLVESVRSMLIDAKLPQRFWALSTAVYLKNRSPTKAVKDVTPYEAWRKEKPKVEHLRVFGWDAYAHVPKDERHKLDSKAKKCIFLGYGQGTKGYRLYDPQRRKVFYSRDVKFNETKREIETESTTIPKTCNKAVREDMGLETLQGRRDKSKLKLWYKLASMSEDTYPRRVFSQDWDAKPCRGRQRKVLEYDNIFGSLDLDKAEWLDEIEKGDSSFLAMVEESIGERGRKRFVECLINTL